MKLYFLDGEYKFSSSHPHSEGDSFLEANWEHGWIQKICGESVKIEDLQVFEVDDKEEVNQVFGGWIPQLTGAGKLSKTMTKGELVLEKEAKTAAREAKKARNEEIKTELKGGKSADEKVDLLMEYLDL